MFSLLKKDARKLEERDMDVLIEKCGLIRASAGQVQDILKELKNGNTRLGRRTNPMIRGYLRALLRDLHSGDEIAKDAIRLELQRERSR